jgi:hypothetical protein
MTEPDARTDVPEPAAPDEDVFGDVLPDTTADEREPDPGERGGEPEDDERILRERPPHW